MVKLNSICIKKFVRSSVFRSFSGEQDCHIKERRPVTFMNTMRNPPKLKNKYGSMKSRTRTDFYGK